VCRRIIVELLVIVALFALAGFIWLHPASRELLAGNTSVMIGDGTDSITNPWQYQLVLDTFRHNPFRILFGAIYTDSVSFPNGQAVFIPWSERLIVLALAPFLSINLMPTAVVWSYIVLSGLAMHICGRLFGFPCIVAFALALAFAVCPYTRARAMVHIALVGVYFAPLAAIGIRILAGSPQKLGWSSHTDLWVSALCLLFSVMAAHYYAIILIAFCPLFIILYAMLAPHRVPKIRAVIRLVLAGSPAFFFLLFTRIMPVSPADAARLASSEVSAADVRETANNFLRVYGARAEDYVGGDVRFGDRDILPWRSAVTRKIRASTGGDYHERTNGIRWTVLGADVVLAIIVSKRGLRRRLHLEERKLAIFACLLGATAFFTSLSPQAIRFQDIEVGPALLIARLIPAFRVPSRVGVLVAFAATLGAGVVFTRLWSHARSGRRRVFVGISLLTLIVVEYLPLHPVMLAPVSPAHPPLPPSGGECGAGITVPYVTWNANETDYYKAFTELRGSSCKIVHSPYQGAEEHALIQTLSKDTFGTEDLSRAVSFARCTRASWVMFRLNVPETFKKDFCTEMGWSFVISNACRGNPASIGPVRPTRECVP